MTECVGNLKHHCISINGCVLPHLRAIFFFFFLGGGGQKSPPPKKQKKIRKIEVKKGNWRKMGQRQLLLF